LNTELIFARKNLTSHFVKIIKFAIKTLGKPVKNTNLGKLEKLKKILNRSSIKIATITNIYRDPTFKFFVEYLKENIMFEKKVLAIIKILNIKLTEKLVMLPLVPGFVYAIHHPW
jgi:hypothetical protein